jgi:hypothetical protein
MERRVLGAIGAVVGAVACYYGATYIMAWQLYQAAGGSVGFAIVPYVAVFVLGVLILVAGLLLLRQKDVTKTR